MKGRVEPEPAFGGKVGLHLDVGDQEAVAEDAAMAFLADQLAHWGTRAVARHQPVGLQGVGALGRVDRQHHAGFSLLDADHLVLPAQVDIRLQARLFVQVAFGVVLLQVDEGGTAMAGFGQEVEAPDLLVAEEHLAHVPGHPLVGHALADAQAVPDFKRALGKACLLYTSPSPRD